MEHAPRVAAPHRIQQLPKHAARRRLLRAGCSGEGRRAWRAAHGARASAGGHGAARARCASRHRVARQRPRPPPTTLAQPVLMGPPATARRKALPRSQRGRLAAARLGYLEGGPRTLMGPLATTWSKSSPPVTSSSTM